MSDLLASPGRNPFRLANPDVTPLTPRRKWGESLSLPQSQENIADPDNVAYFANGGHTNYLQNLDPRHDLGRANARHPQHHNYNSANPIRL